MKIEIDTNLETIKLMTSHYKNVEQNVERVEVTKVKNKFNEPKMCFYNAQRFAQSKGFYVLGFIIIHSIPVEHAWVSDGIHYFDSTPVKSDAYYQVSIISVKNLNHLVSKLGDGYVDLYGVNKCGTSGIKIP